MTGSLAPDFEALYRGESLYPEGHPLRAVFQDIVPWDIGGPQRPLVRLVADGGLRGHVLDAGCGLGDSALYLAGRGYRVTAFDNSPAAIRRATARAESLGVSVEFLIADATALDDLADHSFDTILDNGLLHSLDPAGRAAYLAALRRAAAPEARLYVVCWTDDTPSQLRPPHQDDAEGTRRTLTEAGWAVTRFDWTQYAFNSALTREILHQAMEVTGAGEEGRCYVDRLATDEHGRLLLPLWSITAEVFR
ncbi:class I SAM-dependent methyltransferase [Pseudonocardia eucalypti]|uniref:Class I SAM-dependent methyltransferase n=1 Tax=Pseudonocardia eucalypti TaxID=648755 RepID=A0ABP9QCQ8_9PSEU|nr:SAM-dependent methyltransferase [Pseudonocardia eucalypti]